MGVCKTTANACCPLSILELELPTPMRALRRLGVSPKAERLSEQTDPTSSLHISWRSVNHDAATPQCTHVACAWPTSEGGGSSQPASHVHRRHRIPDPILVCRVVQTLHGAEAGAAVITANHVDPVVKGHRGHVASLPSNALGFGEKRRLCRFGQASLRPHLCGPSWVSRHALLLHLWP